MLNPIKTLAILGAVLLSLFTIVVYAAVDLNYFVSEWNGDQITLRWATGTELDHSAFHVWRSRENLLISRSRGIDRSKANRLTDSFLLNSDKNPCSQQGYEYEYVDDTVDNNEQVYYYYLESFNCSDGRSEFQGSLSTIGGLEVKNPSTPTITPTPYPFSRLYLPIIMRLTPTDYYSFEASQTFYQSNCNLTQVKGIIWDGVNNSRLNGVTVRVWYEGAAFHEHYSAPSGSPPRKTGEWEITLATYAKAGKWYVQVVDRYTGDALSPKEMVHTNNYRCESGQGGHQIVIQDFIKHSVGSGVPISASPTATPTSTPTPASTPTPFDYPSPYPVPPTPASTPTPFDYPAPPTSEITTTPWWSTATPEVTRTATPTPTTTRTATATRIKVPISSRTPSATEPAAVPETPLPSSTPSSTATTD